MAIPGGMLKRQAVEMRNWDIDALCFMYRTGIPTATGQFLREFGTSHIWPSRKHYCATLSSNRIHRPLVVRPKSSP